MGLGPFGTERRGRGRRDRYHNECAGERCRHGRVRTMCSFQYYGTVGTRMELDGRWLGQDHQHNKAAWSTGHRQCAMFDTGLDMTPSAQRRSALRSRMAQLGRVATGWGVVPASCSCIGSRFPCRAPCSCLRPTDSCAPPSPTPVLPPTPFRTTYSRCSSRSVATTPGRRLSATSWRVITW